LSEKRVVMMSRKFFAVMGASSVRITFTLSPVITSRAPGVIRMGTFVIVCRSRTTWSNAPFSSV
jgi:hypothetical protein